MANLFNQYTDLKKNQTPWPTKSNSSNNNAESKFDIAKKNTKKAAGTNRRAEGQADDSSNR
ncbi:hypothetical protein [Macrococcus lamae]|uniref:Uncharacterized protein n=1 Tax=Macrococcus lamae TaxID=198484 RepID=A0A4R6BSL0_9STAP|nr:hypothetical protein [Macrococcus lamae]TDM07133.1 hypothetical protein ERX29_09600 [Macrococcus lamae]